MAGHQLNGDLPGFPYVPSFSKSCCRTEQLMFISLTFPVSVHCLLLDREGADPSAPPGHPSFPRRCQMGADTSLEPAPGFNRCLLELVAHAAAIPAGH